MPWTQSNPPPPAKNWTAEQKRKCVAAANAVIARGGSNPSSELETEAIQACIHAAGKTRHKAKTRVTKAQVRLYEQERDKFKLTLEDLANKYLANRSKLSSFKTDMQAQLKRYQIRVALIAKGKHKFTKRDQTDLQRFLGQTYKYLDGFVEDLSQYKGLVTDQGVISRASSYGVGWGVFSRFSIPGELADILPALPGVSCLGDGDCGCVLEYDNDEEGFNIYWIPNPFKEHCVLCLDNSVEWSPYKVSYDELQAEYGSEVLDENGDFVEF